MRLAVRSSGAGGAMWATGQARLGDIQVVVSGSGALQPGRTEEVRSGLSGAVRRVHVRDGDVVTQGQVLAELDNEAVLLAFEQARLNYEAESERLADMHAGRSGDVTDAAVRAAELKVETARLSLEAREKTARDLSVRADTAALVSQVEIAIGDDVPAGAHLLTLVEGPYARTRVLVPEDSIGNVRVGDRGSVIIAPLPQAHMVRIGLDEGSVYGLKIGDRVRGTVTGQWVPGVSATSEGSVVRIERVGNLFQVTCRLPGLPVDVLTGARVSVEIYPSGRQDGIHVIYNGGNVFMATDEHYLQLQHSAGNGHPASVVRVATQGVKDSSGVVNFEVTLQLDTFPQGARAGMSAHGYIAPAGMSAVSVLTTLETPSRKIITPVGGKAAAIPVREGDLVTPGQLLVTLDNETVLHQLEMARNDLAVQENALRNLTSPQYTEREFQSQDLRLRQAEVNLSARADDVGSLTIRAPQAGKIIGWNTGAGVGRSLAVGFLFCRVANYDGMEVTIQVDELEVDKLQAGMAATVTVDALPGQTFGAQIKSVSQEGVYQQGVSRFAVVLSVEASPRLRSQMTSTAKITVAGKEGALLVPAEAVTFLGDGRGEVNVVQADGSAEPVEIQIGLHNDAHVEVLSGLVAGARVVTGVVQPTTGRIPGFSIPRPGILAPR
jgi:RND family efflux transporter MFP subunit